MNKFANFLEQLDLSDIEASLYTTLLDTGPTSVRDLAVLTKMKRTTAYFYIDQLIEKGLVMKLIHGTQKMVTVSQPKESLQYLVEQKTEDAKSLQTEFPSILKAISTTLPHIETSEDSEIKYFKGVNGVKKIYQEALKSKELRSYFNFELIKEALPDNEILFVQALKENKDIKIYELFQDTPLSRQKVEASMVGSVKHKQYFTKFLPKGVNLSAADILIYDGHVGIVNVRNQFTGVVIKNADYYYNTKEFFDLIWQILPEVK